MSIEASGLTGEPRLAPTEVVVTGYLGKDKSD